MRVAPQNIKNDCDESSPSANRHRTRHAEMKTAVNLLRNAKSNLYKEPTAA
jgi:hypothetical protein